MKLTAKITALAAATLLGISSFAQNPYLPLWEYIPDGEPYVFEDPDNPGKYRIYLYGSHDILVDTYCGRNQVVWSAPVEHPEQWRYDGVVFVSDKNRDGELLREDGQGDLLYAPDICERINADGTKEYYFYPNVQAGGRGCLVAKGKRPDGPFEVCNWSEDDPNVCVGTFGFDPACFIDDDGRVYGYWGGGRKSFAAELDPATMATVKPGTEVISHMVSGANEEGVFRFFEASSIRKFKNKYIFIFSRITEDGEFGLPSSNYTLAYAWSDSPLGPWTYGGTIIDGRARGIDASGKTIVTATPNGNTHGSICRIGRKWWVFYHRQCGTDEFSRQAMVAPIKLKIRKGAVIITEGEYTSEGFMTHGLDPFSTIPAGLACYYTGPKGATEKFPKFWFSGSYVQATRLQEGESSETKTLCPVVNNTAGSVVGYKYIDFRKLSRAFNASLEINIVPQGVTGTICAYAGNRRIAVFNVKASDPRKLTKLSSRCGRLRGLLGKQPVFFTFSSETEGKSICELHSFRFVRN